MSTKSLQGLGCPCGTASSRAQGPCQPRRNQPHKEAPPIPRPFVRLLPPSTPPLPLALSRVCETLVVSLSPSRVAQPPPGGFAAPRSKSGDPSLYGSIPRFSSANFSRAAHFCSLMPSQTPYHPAELSEAPAALLPPSP